MAKAKIKPLPCEGRPEKVKVTLEWDEFLWLFAALSTSNPLGTRSRVEQMGKDALSDPEFHRSASDVEIRTPINPFSIFLLFQDIYDGADQVEGEE